MCYSHFNQAISVNQLNLHPMKSAKLFSSLLAAAIAATVVSTSACAQAPMAAKAAAAPIAAPTTLNLIDRKLGDGALAEKDAPVAVHYTGYLWDATAPDQKGKKFDSSIDRKSPFGFIIGAGRVIKGWDEGVAGMKVGGQRTLIIPPDKGYGERGAGAAIPPNATLVFDVELMSVIGKTQNAAVEPSPFAPMPTQ
jgi:FKBP-type peptidyl-prolyl cis-trans isomerase FkpA